MALSRYAAPRLGYLSRLGLLPRKGVALALEADDLADAVHF
jgi:hypothetical protein